MRKLWLSSRKFLSGFIIFPAMIFLLLMTVTPAKAAFLSIDTGNSWFYGQRGAAVDIDGTAGVPEFGWATNYVDSISSEFVETVGGGYAETYIDGSEPPVYGTVSLEHGAYIEAGPGMSQAYISLWSSLYFDGEGSGQMFGLSDGSGFRAYADIMALTTFTIEAGAGESVGQAVGIWLYGGAWSTENGGPFITETGLQGDAMQPFVVLVNGVEVFSSEILYSPNTEGEFLDGLYIEAAIGDVIRIEAAVWAHMEGYGEISEFVTAESNVYFDTQIDLVTLESVPVPGAGLLMGTGLVLLGMLRRRSA